MPIISALPGGAGAPQPVPVTLTIEGAKRDRINIYDPDGKLVFDNPIEFGDAATAQTTFMIPAEGGEYTFESLVAADIGGSGNYRKSVTLTQNTDVVYVFPSITETDKSNMAYWYGNIFTENIGGIYCVPTGTYNTGNENHSNTVPILESNDIYLQANGQNEYPTKTSMFWFDNKINFSKYNESHILLDYQYSVAQTTSNSVIHNYLHPTIGKPDLNYVLVKFYSDYNSYNAYTYHNYVTDVSAISSEEYLTIFATRAAKAKIYAVYFN